MVSNSSSEPVEVRLGKLAFKWLAPVTRLFDAKRFSSRAPTESTRPRAARFDLTCRIPDLLRSAPPTTRVRNRRPSPSRDDLRGTKLRRARASRHRAHKTDR